MVKLDVTTAAPPVNSINQPTLSAAAVCPGGTLDVTFTASGPYTTGNVFNVELSNASGVFPSTPNVIGSATNTSNTAQTITATIPAATAVGTGYKVRVVATTPAATSLESTTFTVNGVNVTATTTQNILTNTNGTPLTANETGTPNSRQWAYGTASGGPYNNNISGATGTSYTPNFATAGTYYVVVKSMFACGTITSNEVRINVTAPAIVSLTPNTAQSGTGAFTLTIVGTNLTGATAVNFNGTALTPTSATATQVVVTVPAAQIATAGIYDVTVTTPAGTTAPASFTVSTGPLVVQDFEDTPPSNVWTYTGSITRIAGSSASGDRPQNSPYFTSGSKAWSLNAPSTTTTTATATFSNQSVVGYRNAYITFRLAAFSVSSTGNGVDSNDDALVEISLDNGATWSQELQVIGNSNANWSYSATGVAEGTYDGDNSPTQFTPSGGGNRTTDGYSTIKVNLPAYATQVRVRISLTNNATGERWTVDDVALYGTPAPAPTITSFSPTQGPVGTTVTIQGTNFANGATAVLFNGTVASSVSFVSTTELNAIVPTGATTGTIQVAVGGQFATSTSPFTVTVPIYYAKATGDLNSLSTYGLNTDGTGTSPTSFSIANQTFIVTGTGRTISANLTISGAGSKLVVASGAEFIVPAGFNYTGTLDLAANSLLTVLNPAPAYTLGTVDASSTVNYAQTGTFVVPVVATPGYGNLKLTGGTKTFAGNNTTVRGNLTLDGVSNVQGTTSNPFTTIDLQGNFTLLNGTTFDPTDNGRLTLSLSGNGTQTLTGNGTDLLLFRLTTTGTSNAVLSTTGGATNLVLGNASGGGGLALNSGTTLALNGNNVTLTGRAAFSSAPGSDALGALTATTGSNLTINKATGGTPPLGSLTLGPGETLASLTLNTVATGTGSTLFLNSNVAVVNLTLTSGSLVLNGKILTINGTFSAVAAAGFLRGSSTSNLAIGGSGDLGTLNFESGFRTLQNLTVNRTSGGTVTLGNPLTVVGTLTLTEGRVITTATNLLTLGSAASVPAGGMGFVDGPLARQVAANATGPVMFPLGKGSAYRPLTLNVTTLANATTFTAEQKEGRPAAGTPLNGGLTRVSQVRQFTVTPSPAPAANEFEGTITLSFDADDQVTDPAASTLVIAKNSGSSWENIGRSTNGGSANGGAYVAGSLTSGTFTSFSDFALASTDPLNAINPLPVVLTSFTAQRQGEGAVLRWTTAQEKHSAYFEVQRSTNGREFQPLGRVQAAGESTTQHYYSFPDAQLPAGTVYYRLKQVDQDAAVAYSEVRVLGAAGAAATLYPNPVRDVLRVASAAPLKGWRVLSLTGKVLLSGSSPEAGCDVSRLPAGSYALELQSVDGARQTLRFVKE